jgi:hypothetical protein
MVEVRHRQKIAENVPSKDSEASVYACHCRRRLCDDPSAGGADDSRERAVAGGNQEGRFDIFIAQDRLLLDGRRLLRLGRDE